MDTTVRTTQGLIEGFSEDGIFKFLGVPYAEPPVGERRWKLPVPMAEWAGVKTAHEFGAIYALRLPVLCSKRAPSVRVKIACT